MIIMRIVTRQKCEIITINRPGQCQQPTSQAEYSGVWQAPVALSTFRSRSSRGMANSGRSVARTAHYNFLFIAAPRKRSEMVSTKLFSSCSKARGGMTTAETEIGTPPPPANYGGRVSLKLDNLSSTGQRWWCFAILFSSLPWPDLIKI